MSGGGEVPSSVARSRKRVREAMEDEGVPWHKRVLLKGGVSTFLDGAEANTPKATRRH